MLFVTHIPWTSDIKNWQKFYKRPKVSYNEYLRLEKNLDNVDGVAYDVRFSGQTIKYKQKAVSQVVTEAITKNFLTLNDFSLPSRRTTTSTSVPTGR